MRLIPVGLPGLCNEFHFNITCLLVWLPNSRGRKQMSWPWCNECIMLSCIPYCRLRGLGSSSTIWPQTDWTKGPSGKAIQCNFAKGWPFLSKPLLFMQYKLTNGWFILFKSYWFYQNSIPPHPLMELWLLKGTRRKITWFLLLLLLLLRLVIVFIILIL